MKKMFVLAIFMMFILACLPASPTQNPFPPTTAPNTGGATAQPPSFEAVASGRAAAFGSAQAGDGAVRQAPAANSPTTSARSSPASNRTQAIAGALAKIIRAGAVRRCG